MADLKKTIDIILNGEDRASKPMRGLSRTMRGLNDNFGRIVTTGAQAAAAIAAVSGAVSALVGAGLKRAYDQSVQFESAMVDLEKVLGDHPELLDQAKQAATELSNQYGISSTEIVGSIANWVQAGYDVEEATQLAEEAISLMYTSELTATESTRTLTQIMKGFGVEVDDARSKIDAINEISNNYAANVGMLSEALARAAPEADAVGLSMEELAAFMTPAIEKFQDGRRVGTAFKTMLTKLVDDSKPVQDALETMGVAQTNANGELRSGRDILYDVGEAFQNLEPNQQAFIAAQIAGREHSGKFLATMNSWDQVSDVYETAMGSAGSVTEELTAQLESAQRQLDRYGVAWENLGIAIGDQYRVATTEAVEGGTDLINALQESVSRGDFDDLFSVIEEAAANLSETLSGMADALPEALEGVDYGELADSMEDIKAAVSGLFDGLDLTKPDELRVAIQRIVDTGSHFIEFTGTTIEFLGDLGQAFVWATDLFNDFYDILGAIEGPADFFATSAGMIVGVMQRLLEYWQMIPGIDMSVAISGLESLGTKLASYTLDAGDAKTNTEDLNNAINNIPDGKQTDVDVDDNGTTAMTEQEIRDMVAEKTTRVNVDDEGTVEETSDAIEQEIPAEKQLEIQAEIRKQELERDIASIEAAAETMQTKMEWDAKVDIAQAEASMEKFKSAVESVNTGIESTGDVISSLVGQMSEVDTASQQWQIEDWIEAEQERRQQEFDLQKQLVTEQIALAREKRTAMEAGEGMIQIESSGLEPELEAFMWRILEKIQLRANEEASEFLLGI